MLPSLLVLLLSTSQLAFGSSIVDNQAILAPPPEVANSRAEHVVDEAILSALKTHSDPVAALISLEPDRAEELAEKRLLHVVGDENPEWMTEGDKLRLRRQGKKFIDITDHADFYARQVDILSGKASESL